MYLFCYFFVSIWLHCFKKKKKKKKRIKEKGKRNTKQLPKKRILEFIFIIVFYFFLTSLKSTELLPFLKMIHELQNVSI
jgi:uncharacterized membrane protein